MFSTQQVSFEVMFTLSYYLTMNDHITILNPRSLLTYFNGRPSSRPACRRLFPLDDLCNVLMHLTAAADLNFGAWCACVHEVAALALSV